MRVQKFLQLKKFSNAETKKRASSKTDALHFAAWNDTAKKKSF